LTTKIVEIFTTSQLSILFLIISLLAGAAALILTPVKKIRRLSCRLWMFLLNIGSSSEEVESWLPRRWRFA